MKRFSDFKIFTADKIHPNGISILIKAGFKVYEIYGIKNPDLLDFIREKTTSIDSFSCLIIRSVRKFTEIEIAQLSKISVKTICTASSGFDNIPMKACKKHNIKVICVPDGNYISAAEHTLALLLNIMKNINKADIDMKSGKFESLKYVNYELSGRTVGVIGVGRVGSHVAKLCKAFGAKVVGNDIKKTLAHVYNWIEFKELDVLLKVSDIVTVHTPLDISTRNLLSPRRLTFLKNNAIILNCARGGIIDEKALLRKLKSRKIYYAGIDVFENEPDIKKDFRMLSNVLLTPHLAGKTVESKERISLQLAERIIEFYSKKYQ
jgi:D-3-phosphoglycerate dehydrogenase